MTSVELVTIDDDSLLVSLAREIAGDLRPLENVLASYAITSDQFEVIKRSTRFNHLLEVHKLEWDSAGNTYERTKLKSAIMVEAWLPEAHKQLHGSGALPAKIELAKLISKLAGMGLDRADMTGGGGEKLSITINLGSDHKLKFDLPPKVIDAEPS